MSEESNLKKAFRIEAEHHVEYSLYAEIARRENKYETERIFRAAALAELVHAKRQRILAERMQTSDANIGKAIENESFEIYELYPQLIEEAKANHDFAAVASLEDAQKSDKKLVSILVEHQKQKFDTKHSYFVCNTCGFIAIDNSAPVCPVCQDENAIWHEVR